MALLTISIVAEALPALARNPWIASSPPLRENFPEIPQVWNHADSLGRVQ